MGNLGHRVEKDRPEYSVQREGHDSSWDQCLHRGVGDAADG
jgi:hypothetical protein